MLETATEIWLPFPPSNQPTNMPYKFITHLLLVEIRAVIISIAGTE